MNVTRLHFLERNCRLAKFLCLISLFLPLAGPVWAGLPSGWTDADIGSPGMAGSAAYANGNWTVTGGGSDIWGGSDQFNYASTSMVGDGTIIAEVTSLQNSDPGSGWSKAGLMFRNDSTTGSVNVSIVATAGQGVSFQWRGTAGGQTSNKNITGITAPVWLKLVRSAGIFTGSYSTDGSTWVQVTNQSVTMNSTVMAGLDVTAHNNSALNTATFTNVTITIPTLVGEWLDGADSFADVSGYSPAGTHDGYIVGASHYQFANDVPPGKSGQSLYFTNGDTGIAISNSSTLDANYTNTFDDAINNSFTVTCWAKGFPGQWSPWVSKYGETEAGWQLRDDGSVSNGVTYACFTVRNGSVGTLLLGANPYNDPDDMATTNIASNDGNWHFYAGVFDPVTGQRSLYIDGVLAAQETDNTAYDLAAAEHLCIGAKDSPPGKSFGNFSAFKIYDVRIYNYALTAAGVTQASGGIPPVITEQPQSIVAVPGTNAQMSATVGGYPPLYYQWQLDETNLLASANFSGVNSNTLTILNVAQADVGSYQLIVTNAYGMAVSSNAPLTLAVLSAPVVTNLPASNIQPTSATLLGQVLSTGYQTPSVTLFYGPSDGGTNAVAWSNNVALGSQTAVFDYTVAGLMTNATYYYTAWATNSVGAAWAYPSQSFTTPSNAPPVQAILTYRYDNSRQGVNTNEVQLTPLNVNVNDFGKLFSYTVDGYVFAQPLVAPNVTIPGKGVHNVLYVVTENDSVYAFDADAYVPTPYWTTSFLGTGVTTVPGGDANGNVYPVIGCTATPVIDPATGTMYVEAFTKETSGANVTYVHRLHALDITTGLERTNFNSPAVISCTNYPGTGTPGQNDVDGSGHILWNGLRETCRPALLLANGNVYLCYASPGDHPPYYGWVFSYDAHTLAQTGVFNDDPNQGYGGIWMTGNGPAADTNGNVYLNTGNGVYDTSNDYGDSVLKLNGTNDLALEDYFTPYNQASLNAQDLDVSSAGLFLLPDSAGSVVHPHLLLSGSKTGSLFLIDRDTMGHYNSSADTDVQSLNGAVGGMWCSPAYFNGMFYAIGSGDHVKSFTMANATMGTTPTAISPNTFSASATPCLSANGTNNGILWAIDTSGAGSSGAAVLYAYNATNVSQELYSSSQDLARDNPGAGVEFTTPVEANGKVYMGAQYAVSVFGAGTFLAAPVIAPVGGVFTNSVTVTISNAVPGASIYYTVDGTTPTTNSTFYTGPFVITTTTTVNAIVVEPGYVNSAVSSADFINSLGLPPPPWQTSDIGSVGLTGSAYFSNGVFIVDGSGADIQGSGDAFRFVYQTTTGDCTNIARITSVQNINAWSKAGLMIRETLEANSDNAYIALTPGNGVTWQDRSSAGGDTSYNQTTGLSAPYWVMLVRSGNTFTGYYSPDGKNWTQQGTSTLTMAATAYVGLALTSHDNANLAAATFDNVTVNSITYTNPPPGVVLTAPAANSIYSAAASVTMSADADALYDTISQVNFYLNSIFMGSVSNLPYAVTATGLGAGTYSLTAVAVSSSGLVSTSAPVNITVASSSGQPYGLTSEPPTPAFFNMPTTFAGSLPPLLSETGVFSNTPSMTPTNGLIPYQPNVILWSDGAVKTRYMAVPNNGGAVTPDEQIAFAPTNYWTFPAGTVFVKTFQLNTDTSNPNILRRLETRLLVRDINGKVYGVTYKWRPDYGDADLLTNSFYENITITNSGGILTTQTWYYPSPSDCLQCHTPVANYVLGVNTRQLNRDETYAATGVTDNQLRTLNRLGLFNPAFDETDVTNFEKLSALTNTSVSLEDRARSYLDANCAQCHQPRGTGPTFDARYDTPLASQTLIDGALKSDGEAMIVPRDIWRSEIHQRMDTTNTAIRMPPLARQLIDTNAVAVLEDWINSLSGTPALAPVTITPNGGMFFNSVGITLQSTNVGTAIYYTLDSTTPTTNSLLYSGLFNLTSNAVVSASAFETNYINSLAASAVFLVPPAQFLSENISNGIFQMQFLGSPGSNYVLQVSTNLLNWTPMVTNMATTNGILFIDPQSGNFKARFYRVQLLQP